MMRLCVYTSYDLYVFLFGYVLCRVVRAVVESAIHICSFYGLLFIAGRTRPTDLFDESVRVFTLSPPSLPLPRPR